MPMDALQHLSAGTVDPFWAGWAVPAALGSDLADPCPVGRWGAERVLAMDQASRSAACLGGFSAAGLFGASFALFAACPSAPMGLANPARSRSDVESRRRPPRAPADVRGAFATPARRALLALALRVWRVARANGLRLSEQEHLRLAHHLFVDHAWDSPGSAGERASRPRVADAASVALGPAARRQAQAAAMTCQDGPQYSCSRLLRLWLSDAREAGGDALIGHIAALFLSRALARDHWRQRAWALAGPASAAAMPLDLPIPQLAGGIEGWHASPFHGEEVPLLGVYPHAPAEPLALAWLRMRGIGRMVDAEQWRWLLRWRGASPADALDSSQRLSAAFLLLESRLGAGLHGEDLRNSLADGSGSLGLLAELAAIDPSLAGRAERSAEGSFLWRWAERAIDGPVQGPAPRWVKSISELASSMALDEENRFDRIALRSFMDLGEWLASIGSDPFSTGPDGQSPLQKIGGRVGYGELVASWEALELRRSLVLPASAQKGSANAPPRRV